VDIKKFEAFHHLAGVESNYPSTFIIAFIIGAGPITGAKKPAFIIEVTKRTFDE